MEQPLPKIIAIVGPTASGKTGLSLALAKEFNGEVINADSRQVYTRMDIGTDKPAGEYVFPPGEKGKRKKSGGMFIAEGVPHHLVDIVDPGAEFTLADFKTRAQAAIDDILKRGKLPIMVGGTGLYIWSIVDNLDMPKVAPNKSLRRCLEEKSLPELVRLLKLSDPEAAERVDLNNPRRVLRALEVWILTGESFAKQQKKSAPIYDVLQIAYDLPKETLKQRIEERVGQQLDRGLVGETKSLVARKYGWNLPSMSSIGYRQIGYFLRGEMSLEQAVECLKRDTRRYAKRQLTWFKRDKRINWIKEESQARELVNKFLENK